MLVHLPIHARWLNQIEIVFSILQRKVLTPNAFESLFELEASILAFEERYQAVANRSSGNTRETIWLRSSLAVNRVQKSVANIATR